MKVTLINTTDAGGGAPIACTRLLKALELQHTDARMLVGEKKTHEPRITGLGDSFFARLKINVNFLYERLPFIWFKAKDRSVRFAFSMARLGTDISKRPEVLNADILHLHWINGGFLSVKNIKELFETGKPMVWTLHDLWAFTGGCHYPGDCRHFEQECGNCWMLRNPDENDISFTGWLRKQDMYKQAENIVFVTCSRWLADVAHESSLLKGFRIEAIPNPIDTELFSAKDKTAARAKWGIDQQAKIILFGAANILDRRKGFSYLVDALHELKKKYRGTENIELVIFGKNKSFDVASLPFKVYELNTIGSQDELAELYSLADVFVTPAIEDNLPNTIILSDGLFGVVERGAARDEGLHPVGTGPFRFVSQVQDKEVVVERNAAYWAGATKLERVRFQVVPDTITAALEMKKGSADVESNVLTLDMVHALRNTPGLVTQTGPGARVDYANFNVQDPALRDPRVRQAIASAINRPALIAALWRGQARLADTLLPPGHWAAASPGELAQYPHDVARAIHLLDAAGLKPDKDDIRLRITLKTSTDETTRLEAQAIQAQLREAGIALQLRSAEFGTFYADITHGAFQMYMLRWIGSNEDPDIFHYAYATSMAPPKGANRGRFSNTRIDALLQAASAETDEAARRRNYIEVQQILAEELPSIPLWYPDNVVVHSTRVTGIAVSGDGSYDFLRSASLR